MHRANKVSFFENLGVIYPFIYPFSYLIPLEKKTQKTKGFLKFLWGDKLEQWPEIG